MKTLKTAAVLLLAMSVSVGAMAQSALPPPAPEHSPIGANAVGRWLYNEQGDTIGSVRSLADGGQTATLMIGSYLRPGSYEAQIPASNLSIVNGKVTLRSETVLALNTSPHR